MKSSVIFGLSEDAADAVGAADVATPADVDAAADVVASFVGTFALGETWAGIDDGFAGLAGLAGFAEFAGFPAFFSRSDFKRLSLSP